MDTNEGKKKLLDEYRERSIRWRDKTVSQLSFYNNLLLTLGVGFLSFAYSSEKIRNVELTLPSNDCSLIVYSISIITIVYSILVGFLVGFRRLYDFRITSQINLVRQRCWEHSNEKLDGASRNKFPWWRRIFFDFSNNI